MNQELSTLPNLDWRPQESFSDFFYTDTQEILTRRTVFLEDIDYFVPYGGRGSAKSFTFLDAVVVEASLRPVRILCAREIQLSIKESVKAEIEAAIITRGLENFFNVLRDEIRGLNGSEFMFKGIKNNIRNLKSISDVDILLSEESEGVTKNSWDKLLPSIRPRKPFGNRGNHPINIIIFNPDDELDDTYQRFIINTPPRSIVRLINWRDNKYFPEHLNEMRLHSLKTRPKKDHEHDWEGKPKAASEDVIIDRDWIRAARFASKNPDFIHCGDRKVSYDPAGQGKDANARVYADGNIIKEIDEWVRSTDLKKASKKAFRSAVENSVDLFIFDTCGGFGDGVSVFVDDAIKDLIIDIKKDLSELEKEDKNDQDVVDAINRLNSNMTWIKSAKTFPFDAGSSVVNPAKKIPGTKKTWGEQYSNAKAQVHAITAQKLYNTYRFIILGEREIDPNEMMSIDIEDDSLFNKLTIELSSPLWVKSGTNSKKKVEEKKAMLKRTGLPSPNIGDSLHMLNAPQKRGKRFNG